MSAIRRAVLFSSGERYVVVVLNLLQTMVASRLLSAGEIGLVALGFAITQVLDAVRDLGLASYLVQRESLSRAAGRTVLTILLIMSVLFGAGLIAGSTLIAEYYELPALRQFLIVTAIAIVISPFSTPLFTIMRRDLEFGSVAVINCFAAAVQTITLIALASANWGAVSYAWAMVGCNVAGVAACLVVRPDLRWIYRPCLQDWRRTLAFGGVSSATALFNRLYELLPVFVLGRMFPIETVGLFNRAMVAAQLPERLLLTSVASVVLPALSQTARQGGSLPGAYLAGLTFISVVQWPALILIAALADPLVAVLLGPQWSACVPIVQLTALASLLYFPAILSYPTMVAGGGLRDTLTSSIIHLPLGATVVLACSSWGPLGIAAGQFIAMPLLIWVDIVFIRRRAPFSWRQFARAVNKSAVVTLCSAAFPAAVVSCVGPGGPISLDLALVTVAGAGAGWICGVAATRHPIGEHILAVLQSFRSRMRATGALNSAK